MIAVRRNRKLQKHSPAKVANYNCKGRQGDWLILFLLLSCPSRIPFMLCGSRFRRCPPMMHGGAANRLRLPFTCGHLISQANPSTRTR